MKKLIFSLAVIGLLFATSCQNNKPAPAETTTIEETTTSSAPTPQKDHSVAPAKDDVKKASQKVANDAQHQAKKAAQKTLEQSHNQSGNQKH